jgi:hypothetical protein
VKREREREREREGFNLRSEVCIFLGGSKKTFLGETFENVGSALVFEYSFLFLLLIFGSVVLMHGTSL